MPGFYEYFKCIALFKTAVNFATAVLALAALALLMIPAGVSTQSPAGDAGDGNTGGADSEPDRHDPPLRQQADGADAYDILCNAPLQLYLRDSQPLCLNPVTYGLLTERGIGLDIPLTEEERAWLSENPEILVAVDPNWIPFEYVDESGRIAGITGQYVQAFEAATGADFVHVPFVKWSDLLDSLRNGTSDMVFMITNTEERKEYMGFTTPHIKINAEIATLGSEPVSVEDLVDLRVATVRDYAIETWLDENHPGVEYISVDTTGAGLEMLEAGEVDAFLEAWLTIVYHGRELGIEGLYRAGTIDSSDVMSIGYRIDEAVLGSILQKTQDRIPPIPLELQ